MNARSIPARLRLAWLAGWLGVLPTWAADAAEAAAAKVQPLRGAAYEATALKVEEKVRQQVDAALHMQFHRAQAFRIGAQGAQLVSVEWSRDSGGETHCVLGAATREGVRVVDALQGETDMPWSCEGEPAVRITDLDGDGCPEVLAQYDMRPPSGERFVWGVVLRCEGSSGAYVFDAERSARWRAAQHKPPRINTLRQAERLLRSAPAAR